MRFFSPHHVQLINACYPPSSALSTSGPDYRPNTQELSRLTYYASNRSGKLNKLGSELLKRVKLECRKAQSGSVRMRALVAYRSFLMTHANPRREARFSSRFRSSRLSPQNAVVIYPSYPLRSCHRSTLLCTLFPKTWKWWQEQPVWSVLDILARIALMIFTVHGMDYIHGRTSHWRRQQSHSELSLSP